MANITTLPKFSLSNNNVFITSGELTTNSHSSIPDMWNTCNTLSLEMELSNKYMNKARDVTDLISMLFGEDIKIELIKKVIFNDPATVILWIDGTKTVVRCQDGEKYDPEKGLAMALIKKMCGNKGNYYKIFTKVLKKFGPEECE